jgi:HK97 family phage major capsid protein
MNQLLELKQKRAALIAGAQEKVELTLKEGRAFTSAEQEMIDKVMADASALAETIKRAESLAAVDTAIKDQRDQRKDATGKSHDEQREAFMGWVRHGAEHVSQEQRGYLIPADQTAKDFRAQSAVTGSTGGYVVPEGFYPQVQVAMKYFGGMFQCGAKELTTTGGNDLPIPTGDDTSNKAVILSENVQTTTPTDLKFGAVTLKAFMYTSKPILIPFQLLQDSGIDLEAYVTERLATRFGRGFNEHLTIGDGTSQPRGIVNDAALGKTGTTGQTTTVIYNDLQDLRFSVDRAYRQQRPYWMMHDSTLKAILKLVDSQGRPLILSYQAPLREGEPESLLGDNMVINNDVPVMAASAKSILYGDFSNFFIRRVRNMMMLRLVERYADYGQVGFLAFMRGDGRLVDAGTNPVKYYANSAS